MTKASENRHLIMGYLFLGLVFMGAISSVYYWEYKAKNSAMMVDANRHVESGEQIPTVEGVNCNLEPVLARHIFTGEMREFSSPCHVVDNWEIIDQ